MAYTNDTLDNLEENFVEFLREQYPYGNGDETEVEKDNWIETLTLKELDEFYKQFKTNK